MPDDDDDIIADALATLPRQTRSRVEDIIDSALMQMAAIHRRDLELVRMEVELLREERDRLYQQLAEVRLMLDRARARR